MQPISPRRALCVLSLAISVPVSAQTVPLPDETRRPQQPPALPSQTPPRVLEAPLRPSISMPDGVSVTPSGFRVSGARSYSQAQLEEMLASFVGKKLDIRGLNDAAGVLTRFYQSNGHFLSYAYLPAQRVADGMIEIAVLEGRLEAAQIVTAQEVRLRDTVIQAYTDPLVSAAKDPSPVLQAAVERQLLLLNDISGVTARGAFTPGSTTGGAEMVVSVAEDEPLEARLEANNHGAASTGRYRAGMSLSFKDLFGWGDSIQARGFTSNRGSLVSGNLSGQVPLGGDGWRVGASVSRVKYQLNGAFRNLAAEGTADTTGVDAGYALKRSSDGNLTLRAAFDHKRLRDDKGAALFQDTQRAINTGEVGVSGDFRDAFGGVGAGSLTATHGSTRARGWDAAPAPVLDKTSFNRVNLQFVRQQSLFGAFSVYGRVTLQATEDSLDSSEKLGLGGANAVRAYSSGEASIDNGAIGSIELRYTLDFLGGSMTGSLFQDYGGGRDRQGLRPIAAYVPYSPELAGTGLGLSWTSGNLGLNASIAWRNSARPTAEPSDPRPRLFFQMFYTP